MDLTQFKGGEMNTESPHPTYQAVVNGEHREYATKDSEWYFHAGWTWDGFKGQWYRKITEGEEMQEKIALTEKELAEKIQAKVNKFIETQIDSLTHNFRVRGWLHKDDPVDGFDCTLGELPEQARKMREALIHIADYWNGNVDNERTMVDALYTMERTARDALTFKDK